MAAVADKAIAGASLVEFLMRASQISATDVPRTSRSVNKRERDNLTASMDHPSLWRGGRCRRIVYL